MVAEQRETLQQDCDGATGRWCTPMLFGRGRCLAKAVFVAVAMFLAVGVVADAAEKSEPVKCEACVAAKASKAGEAKAKPAATAQKKQVLSEARKKASGKTSGKPNVGSKKGELESIDALLAEVAKNDFVFAVLPGMKKQSRKNVAVALKPTVKKLRAEGVGVATFTMKRDSKATALAAKRLNIQDLPAVLALKQGGQGAVVTGDITQARLLEAYLHACKSCGDCGGCGSGGCGGCGSGGCGGCGSENK